MDETSISAPDDRLPLVVTIGFTGHRAVDDRAGAEKAIAAALKEVRAAFELAQEAPYAAAYDGHPRLRLLVGAAPGTDRLVAAAWRGAGFEGVHTIYPFRDPRTGAAFTDNPAKADPQTRIETTPDPEPWTGIDALGFGFEGNRAHGEVARWIVRHADVLIAWWNGEQATAPGGAGDTMRRALERGIPVVWLKPGVATPRLIDPIHIQHHADAAEAMAGLEPVAAPLDAGVLAELLEPVLAPPGDAAAKARDPEVLARLDYDAVDPMHRWPVLVRPVQWLLERSVWRSFRAFEAIAGAEPPVAASHSVTPAMLAAQPGFKRLEAAAKEAAARAASLSGVHRSEQLVLIAIAILAVLVGASPALSDKGHQIVFHVGAAAAEFVLGGAAFIIFDVARQAHRHRRWSDARRLAERLRAATSTWPLGFDIADDHATAPQTWTEWRVRALVRAAGPPRGWIEPVRFRTDAAWAADRLIASQVAYHGRQRRVAEHIERFVGRIEAFAFGGLMLMLFGYLIASIVVARSGLELDYWVSGLVTVVSAVSPAIGAGCLALEATNGFGELALRSGRLAEGFEDLQERLAAAPPAAYHPITRVMRRAAQLLVEDADAWRDRLLRRRLVRGA